LHFWCFTCEVTRCSRTHFTCESKVGKINGTHYLYGQAATLSLPLCPWEKSEYCKNHPLGYHHQVLLFSLHQLERFCNSMYVNPIT
jgi:hypothetical protein